MHPGMRQIAPDLVSDGSDDVLAGKKDVGVNLGATYRLRWKLRPIWLSAQLVLSAPLSRTLGYTQAVNCRDSKVNRLGMGAQCLITLKLSV